MIETLKIKHRYAHFRSLYTHDRRLIDQGIVIFYPHTSSFNGEDIIELQVHGGRSIIKLLFEELRKLGFRMAEKG
jgi:tRNA modification GTPase